MTFNEGEKIERERESEVGRTKKRTRGDGKSDVQGREEKTARKECCTRKRKRGEKKSYVQ